MYHEHLFAHFSDKLVELQLQISFAKNGLFSFTTAKIFNLCSKLFQNPLVLFFYVQCVEFLMMLIQIGVICLPANLFIHT